MNMDTRVEMLNCRHLKTSSEEVDGKTHEFCLACGVILAITKAVDPPGKEATE